MIGLSADPMSIGVTNRGPKGRSSAPGDDMRRRPRRPRGLVRTTIRGLLEPREQKILLGAAAIMNRIADGCPLFSRMFSRRARAGA
jgi:hypothetical protein